MDEKIDKAIDIVLGLVRTNLKADEALKTTQAVLNLMHAKQLQQGKPTTRKQAASA